MSDIYGPDGITPISSSQEQAPIHSPFIISSVFGRQTMLSVVKMKELNAEKSFLMTPTEARILGLQLIMESEKAICQAAMLRAMLEMGEMPIEQAIEAMNTYMRITREALRIAELEAEKATEKREADNGDDQAVSDRKDSTH